MPEGKNRNLYFVWKNMIGRCEKPERPRYKDYGGRGIKVCNEWHTFKTFEKWAIENGYTQGLSLDRINNNGDYNPSNCRFTDIITQQNNRRNNHIITLNGETHTFAEWLRILNLPKRAIYFRIERGMSVEEALTKPINKEMQRRRKRTFVEGED